MKALRGCSFAAKIADGMGIEEDPNLVLRIEQRGFNLFALSAWLIPGLAGKQFGSSVEIGRQQCVQ